MEAYLLNNLSALYALIFITTFCAVALWESLAPRRVLTTPIRLRWFSNACLLTTTSLLYWILFPATGIGTSVYAAQQGWGLMHLVSVPYWVAFAASILLLDLGHFGIHYLFHQVPVLWRMHRLHHTDHDFDVSTAVRFHPFEAGLETSMNLLIIFLIGPPVLAVVLFYFSYVLTTFWVHGNLRMPWDADRHLRRLFITPDMHRTHHSQDCRETNSNYGGLFSFWDRLFGTYIDEPALGHECMAIGLPEFSDRQHARIDRMLLNPFLSPPAAGDVRESTGTGQSPRNLGARTVSGG